jgi:SAM-dependent methyltransferase
VLSRQYAKGCDLPDFQDPELISVCREILPEHDLGSEPWRKAWEFGLGALFLGDVGRLTEDTEILDVGAGRDQILYWLANRVGRVVATDIYGEGAFGQREADLDMLKDPSASAPFPYRENRLEARYMDGRQLDFPDETFDAVVSFSSIEHFGDMEDIARSAAEIGRVLRPGGHAFIATECFVRFHLLDRSLVHVAVRLATLGRRARNARLGRHAVGDVLTERDLHRHLVQPSGLALMQPLDLRIAPQTWENISYVNPDGSTHFITTTGQPYPQILVGTNRSVFNSVCLPLVKPGPSQHPAPRAV